MTGRGRATVDQYAKVAQRHWRATFPEVVAGLPDPDSTFRQLERLVQRRLDALDTPRPDDSGPAGSGPDDSRKDAVLAELVLLPSGDDPRRVLRLLPSDGEPPAVVDRLLADTDVAAGTLREPSAAIRTAAIAVGTALAGRDGGAVGVAVTELRTLAARYAAAQGATRDSVLVLAVLSRLRGRVEVPAVDPPPGPLPVLPEPPADGTAEQWQAYRSAADAALAQRTDRLRDAATRVAACWQRVLAVAMAGDSDHVDAALTDVRRRADALADAHGEWAAAAGRARAARPHARTEFADSLLAVLDGAEPDGSSTGPGSMSVRDARGRYATALLFALEVSAPDEDLVGEPASSDLVRDAYVAALFQDNLTWEYCDNPYDLDAAADSALRATVRYQSAQQAHEVPVNRALPVRQWPDAESRVGELHAALVFAAECAESVWTGPLDAMLQSWLRARLDTLLAPPAGTEPYPRFEERIRHATRLTHRYRATLRGLFGDRMWADRPVDRWWCPDDDLAVHGSFHELGGARRPTYALLLHGPGRATLAVAATATGTPRWHTVEVSAEGLIASGDPHPDDLAAAREAVQALGRSVLPPTATFGRPPES